MDNPQIITEGFSCEELAEALMLKLKPFIQESIRVELEKINEIFQVDKSNEEVNGFSPVEPIVSNNGRYSATQVCKMLSIHRNTLRNHTDAGNIRCGIRKANGRKFYLGSDIIKFWKASF